MKAVFEKYKYEIINQNGVSLVVAGFSKSHVIGATKEENNHTWRELDEGS